jgi:hypothetical protein
MFLMRADTLRGQVGGNREFFGPCEMASSQLRRPFGAQKTRDFQGPNPHQKSLRTGMYNHRCIGGFMYKSPPVNLTVLAEAMQCTDSPDPPLHDWGSILFMTDCSHIFYKMDFI